MKELSIEEKAQRYDEALERANELLYVSDKESLQYKTIKHILPELKESKENKDEKIRKKLLSSFKGIMADADEDELWYGLPYNDIIAWLEKQKPIALCEDDERIRKTILDILLIDSDEIREILDVNNVLIQDIDTWLEKQGNISPTEDELEALRIAAYEPTKNWNEKLQSLYEKLIHCEQGEQKEATCVSEIIDRLSEKEQEILFKELNMQKKHNKFIESIQIGDKVTRNEDGVLVNLSQLNRVAKKDEKQGEQKHTPKHKIGDTIYYNSFGEVKSMIIANVVTDSSDNPMYEDENGSAVFEKDLVEQKPDDKVEPKFNVGDWVVIDGEVLHVKEVTEDGYLTDEGGHIPFRNEKEVHIWTIQDAKDGDVLCTYECCNPKIVFILKGTPKKHYALSYHCYYNIMYPHFGSDSEKGCLAPNDEDVKPATKEQRDLLFQKMKEAGYEWDAEKKDLKEIEQKPGIAL